MDRQEIIASTPSRWKDERGSALLISLLVLGALSILASTIVVNAMGDRNLTKYERHSLMALGAAESGVAFAKRAIVTQNANMTDYDADGRPDFVLSDSLDSGGSYTVVSEASDIKGLGITAYQSNGFAIISQGEFLGAARRVKAEIVHDSFLKFARFVSSGNLSYACGAALTGEVYSGANINVPCGCSGGQEAQFLESAYAVDDIPNAGCGVFYRGYITDAEEIDLSNSFDWNDTRDKADGTGPENECDGKGDAGIYMSLPGTDPLGLGAQPGADNNVLLLHQFDFQNTVLVPGDTVITYAGNAVIHPVNGVVMRYDEFNGIVFFDSGDAYVRGTIDGKAAHSLTIFGTDDVYVMGDIITGHTGYNPGTGLPTGTGDPVNIGLVAEDYVYMDDLTPRVLRVDAALFSRTTSWRATGTTGSHPPVAAGVAIDLDLDGITGENPVNHDPVPGTGWDEVPSAAEVNKTWVLNITGPIITNIGGSAYPWNDGGVLANADGPTRRYNYDLDVTEYPPPCFPVPLNLWKDVSWTEIFDLSDDITANLPN